MKCKDKLNEQISLLEAERAVLRERLSASEQLVMELSIRHNLRDRLLRETEEKLEEHILEVRLYKNAAHGKLGYIPPQKVG
jgi:hypothetical protein